MAKQGFFLRRLTHNPFLSFLGIVLLLWIVYWPGLHGPYVLDDGENILLNSSVALTDITVNNVLTALMSNDSGPLKRPIAAISFALNHYFNAGFYPTFAFKTTNLVIHLLNTYLIYFLCVKLLSTPRLAMLLDDNDRRRAAIFTAALWALHPIQLTNILYVVQRMNSLATLFMLMGLILFVQGRSLLGSANAKGLSLMLAGILGGIGFGLASKENAALLPLFALVIEYTLFGFKTQSKNTQRYLLTFYILLVALPIGFLATYLATHPDFIANSYVTRHFSLAERLLTETRVLWHYVGLILFPVSKHFGLFHDDIALSAGLFTPISTVFAVIGILVSLGLGITQVRRYPILSFAILWFLAGHALESSFLGLELAYEHRNYLPSYGILLATAFGFISVTKNKHLARPVVLVSMILMLSFVTWTRANIWGDIRSLAEHTVRTHPYSPRANDFAARTSLAERSDREAAIRYTLNGLRLAPDEVGFHVDMQILLSPVASQIEHATPPSNKRNKDHRFDVHITGMKEKLQAVENKEGGVFLSYKDSNPDIISALLKAQPITVHGIFSLENLRRCILEPPQSCARLRGQALSWLTIAAENPRTSRQYRAILAGNTAMLYADTNNLVRALDYMGQAATLLPEYISYRIARTEYLIRLGRLEEAKRAIDSIAAEPNPTDTPLAMHESNIRQLRALYDNAARENRALPSSPK